MTTDYEFNEDDQRWLKQAIKDLTFAKALRSHRLCEEWTQAEMALKLGITKQMLSAYETGKRIPTPKKASEIASTIGLLPETAILLAVNDELRASNLSVQMKITH